jgi:hypothetical protein
MTDRSRWECQVGDLWYRAECDGRYLRYDEYTVVKTTPCGVWLVRGNAVPAVTWNSINLALFYAKWIPGSGKWASPTKEQALERLRRRTASYVWHCRRRLREAEERARCLEHSGSQTREDGYRRCAIR